MSKSFTKKITKKEVLDLFKALSSLNLKGAKFASAVSRNIQSLKPEVTALQNAYKADPKFMEFEQKRIAIGRKYSKKDEKNIPVVENDSFILDEANIEKCNEEINALREEYREHIVARDLQTEEFNKITKELVQVTLYAVDIEDVPQDISSLEMSGIIIIVTEDKKNG